MAPWFEANQHHKMIPASKSGEQPPYGTGLPPTVAAARVPVNMHMNGNHPLHLPPHVFSRQPPAPMRAPYPHHSHPLYRPRPMPPLGGRAPMPTAPYRRGPFPSNPNATVCLPPPPLPTQMRRPAQMGPYARRPPSHHHRMPYAPPSQMDRPPVSAPGSHPMMSGSAPMPRPLMRPPVGVPTADPDSIPPLTTASTSANSGPQQEEEQSTALTNPTKVESNMKARASRDKDAAEILLCLRKLPTQQKKSSSLNSGEIRVETTEKVSPDAPVVLPTRLSMPEDRTMLNSMHCFLRSDLLEVFVVEHQSPKTICSTASGRVGLRCVHCAQARIRNGHTEGEAPMAVFYPKSISELYRLVTSWQRVHVRKCRNLPPSVRAAYISRKENDKTRGKTQYWVTSAKALGLIDCTSKGGGVRFSQAPYGVGPERGPQQPMEGLPETASIQSSDSSETISTASLSSETSGFSSDIPLTATV